jgi:hypothetical protein
MFTIDKKEYDETKLEGKTIIHKRFQSKELDTCY